MCVGRICDILCFLTVINRRPTSINGVYVFVLRAFKKGGCWEKLFPSQRPALAGRGFQREGVSVGSSAREERKSSQGLQHGKRRAQKANVGWAVDWGVKLETGQFPFLANNLKNSWRVGRCAKPILLVLDNAILSKGEYYTVFLHLAMSHLGYRWVLH